MLKLSLAQAMELILQMNSSEGNLTEIQGATCFARKTPRNGWMRIFIYKFQDGIAWHEGRKTLCSVLKIVVASRFPANQPMNHLFEYAGYVATGRFWMILIGHCMWRTSPIHALISMGASDPRRWTQVTPTSP